MSPALMHYCSPSLDYRYSVILVQVVSYFESPSSTQSLQCHPFKWRTFTEYRQAPLNVQCARSTLHRKTLTSYMTCQRHQRTKTRTMAQDISAAIFPPSPKSDRHYAAGNDLPATARCTVCWNHQLMPIRAARRIEVFVVTGT